MALPVPYVASCSEPATGTPPVKGKLPISFYNGDQLVFFLGFYTQS